MWPNSQSTDPSTVTSPGRFGASEGKQRVKRQKEVGWQRQVQNTKVSQPKFSNLAFRAGDVAQWFFRLPLI